MKTLQVRISDDLRSNADAVLEDIGLDMPTAIRLYLNKIVQTRSIPFTLEADGVTIEDAEYLLACRTPAFAVVSHFRTFSQPNPYSEKVLALYIKKGKTLKKLIDNFTVYKRVGEVNVNYCYSSFKTTTKSLSVANKSSIGFAHLNVSVKNSKDGFRKDKNGHCVDTVFSLTENKAVLKFNGKRYEETK